MGRRNRASATEEARNLQPAIVFFDGIDDCQHPSCVDGRAWESYGDWSHKTLLTPRSEDLGASIVNFILGCLVWRRSKRFMTKKWVGWGGNDKEEEEMLSEEKEKDLNGRINWRS